MTDPRRPAVPIDPEVGIPDLIRRLSDDSRRLASDEVRLAKLELADNLHTSARGTLWLSLSFGVGVVCVVALTIFIATLIGRLVNFHYWLGSVVVGVLELGVAFLCFKRGVGAFAKPNYSFEETRESLKDTTTWVAERAD